MGGWRCSYRNCSAGADGKTHLFHYPVFDKVRCLKWLQNAGKLEFLNLKLSQLKNRVICQHHFKDECFMNYKKDKLTFVAVPTESGIFSDPSFMKHEKINLPISLEDIENSETRALTAREKKANFSIKYADFLIDPLIHSADNIPETETCKKVNDTEKDNDFISFKIWSHKTHIGKNTLETPQFSVSQPLFSTYNVDKINYLNLSENIGKVVSLNVPKNVDNANAITFNVSENVDKQISCHVSKNVERGISFNVDVVPTTEILNLLETKPIVADRLNSNKLFSDDILSSSQINQNYNTSDEVSLEKKCISKNKNKIKILSEKTLTVPLPVMGTFEPVCPTGILNPRKRKVETELQNKEISIFTTIKEESEIPEQHTSRRSVEHMLPAIPNETQNEVKIISSPKKDQKGNILSYSKSPNTRNKIPPERVAAIEEKRTFNKKLRDMIEFCLDDKEDNAKMPVKENSPQTSRKQSEKCTKEHVKKVINVETELESNEKKVIGNSQNNATYPDYKMTVLEAKLSTMENLLLKKVGENTQRIDSLKRTLLKSNDVQKKSIQTQTIQDKEIHKKELFNEISRYLSPELNSLLYEELFMKEFEPEITYSNKSKKKIKRQRR